MWRVCVGVVVACWAGSAWANGPELPYSCGCKNRYDIETSNIAFRGRLVEIRETKAEDNGAFPNRVIDLTFIPDAVWKGGNPRAERMIVRTDATSCGYGAYFVPEAEQNAIGGVYGIFAAEGFLHMCNSVVVDETWFAKHKNPFVSR